MKKKTFINRLLAPLLAFIFLLNTAVPVAAADFPNGWPDAPEIADETGVLMEASTGQILFDKDMDEIRYPASTTKIMTALLIIENVKDLNAKVTFTDIITPDLAPGNSSINARVGEVLTVEECLYAILLASANEVCTQMAVYVAGSVSSFTDMMNDRAAQLGCINTNFVNANGLPDPNHYTTAHDLALILAEAVKNEAFCKVAGAGTYTIAATNMTPYPRNLENHNALLTDSEFHYEGAIAGKTGHTEAAKNTLVTAAAKNDMTLVCVVLRSDGNDRFTDTKTLFDYGFDNFHKVPLYWTNPEEPAGYAILPNNVNAGSLLARDQDADGIRTRTYSYRGTEVFRTSQMLPMEIKTRMTADITAFKTKTIEKTSVVSTVFIVTIIFLTIICVLAAVFVIKEAMYQKQHPIKKKKKEYKTTGEYECHFILPGCFIFP